MRDGRVQTELNFAFFCAQRVRVHVHVVYQTRHPPSMMSFFLRVLSSSYLTRDNTLCFLYLRAQTIPLYSYYAGFPF